MGYAFLFGLIMSVMVWLIVHRGVESREISESSERPQVQQSARVQAPTQAPVSATVQERESKHEVRQSEERETKDDEPAIRVFLSESSQIEEVTLEDYVRGVVAAEMPLSFESAALEAQALAARTYIVRRLWLNKQLENKSGVTAADVDVTDTQNDQVYKSLSTMRMLRQNNRTGWAKVDKAVANTAGDIIVFEDQPIEALYFSTSNGYTENSEEVFPTKLPYLRSVASPWDKESSPRAKETIEMSLAAFYDKLGVKVESLGGARSKKLTPQVLARTKGSRVKVMRVGKQKFTGIEIRRLLGLRSSAFEWKISNNRITLTTYGSGHGVGMSQWGADGMARAGKTTEQIVQHYYSGTHIEKAAKLLNDSKKQ